MQARRRADIWEEVWAEYDSRQQGRGAGQPVSHPQRVPQVSRDAARGGSAPRRRVRPLAHAGLGLMAGMVVLALWFALPWVLAMRLSVPIGQGDAPGLLRQFDTPTAMASLRAGLAAEIPEGSGEGARRFLEGMAERMAASWENPEAVASWLAMRARGGRFEGSPVPLSALRSARPTGLTSFRVEYGPSVGEGGVAFDLAWQGDGFRVTGVNFLGAPPAPLGIEGPVLALR